MDFYFKFDKIKSYCFVYPILDTSNEKIPASFNTRYREPKCNKQLRNIILILVLGFINSSCNSISQEKLVAKYEKKLKTSNKEKAEKLSRKLLSIDSNNIAALNKLGTFLNDSCAYYLKKSLSIKKNQILPLYYLGTFYRNQSGVYSYSRQITNLNYLDSAIHYYSKCLSIDSSLADVFYDRGFCYYYHPIKNYKILSQKDMEKACALNNDLACRIVKTFY
jgi:tetratricopeptide (TPR) repeat protein